MKKRLGPAPHANHAAAEEKQFSLISNQTLKKLYTELLAMQLRKRRSALHFHAAQVAIAHDLRPGDTVRIATRRRARTALPFPATVGLLDVLGAALAHQAQKNAGIALVWATDADSSALRTALEAARAHKLPAIFVVECPDAAASSAVEDLLNRNVAPGEEMPHIAVDGNDVIAVYRVAHEAIDRARRDRGPTLIECLPFRVQGQPAGRHLNPVANMERYLRGKGLLPRNARQEILTQLATPKRAKK